MDSRAIVIAHDICASRKNTLWSTFWEHNLYLLPVTKHTHHFPITSELQSWNLQAWEFQANAIRKTVLKSHETLRKFSDEWSKKDSELWCLSEASLTSELNFEYSRGFLKYIRISQKISQNLLWGQCPPSFSRTRNLTILVKPSHDGT